MHSKILLVLEKAMPFTSSESFIVLPESWGYTLPQSLYRAVSWYQFQERWGTGCARACWVQPSSPQGLPGLFWISIPQQARHPWFWWAHCLGPWAAPGLIGIKSSGPQGCPTAFLFWCLLPASCGELQNGGKGGGEGVAHVAGILTFLLKEALNKYPSAFREENSSHQSFRFSVHDQMLSSAICVPVPSSAAALSMDLLSDVLP